MTPGVSKSLTRSGGSVGARAITVLKECPLAEALPLLAKHIDLNFLDGVVEMGHDGPAHLAISARQPLLRGLGIFHGKRGWGVSVEFDVRPGPVTAFGLAQDRDGTFSLVASEGTVVPGPLLRIGNTTSRVDFGRDPGEWTDEWSASGIAHHWALGTGHRVPGE